MRTLLKLTFGLFAIGSLALLGSALLQTSAGGAHGRPSGGDAMIQSASAQVDSILRQASIQLGPGMRSFSIRARAFARSNALEARMQFAGMASYFSMNGWRHGSTPYWMKTGVQGATQASGEKAMAMAKGMPMVQAVRSNIDRLADAHPALSASSSGF
jgi:hypothetical protein